MLDRVLLRPVDWDPLTILAAEDLPHVDIDALEAAMRRGGGPTRDDVTIRRDGTRLDTPSKSREWVAAIVRERRAESAVER